ncbi:DNA alkylation repair protein [Methanogenium sp. MK-MG]|uniref:DNA alkylation repair protein n=1 Tax=Methanogenium sp. MK-MG TaxID=2599926 RepID=UPI0013ED2EDD|nr:DNA alkylation repair protein [Methanogenium sp. MK-MG]KAF1077974.1 hypothetical protein MKMG_01137 [Methanogenium sp. MK-MG]
MANGTDQNTLLIQSVIQALETHRDPAYFEREVLLNGVSPEGFIGVRRPDIRATAKIFWPKVKVRDTDDILSLCNALLEEEIFDLRAVATDWAYRPKHLNLFERWLKTHTHTTGLTVNYPRLKSWACPSISPLFDQRIGVQWAG